MLALLCFRLISAIKHVRRKSAQSSLFNLLAAMEIPPGPVPQKTMPLSTSPASTNSWRMPFRIADSRLESLEWVPGSCISRSLRPANVGLDVALFGSETPP